MSTVNKQLVKHHKAMSTFDMRTAFADDQERANRLSLEAAELFLDYSKNLINDDTMALLIKLAKEKKVLDKFRKQISAKEVNPTERQAATHTAMRGQGPSELTDEADKIRKKMYGINQKVLSGQLLGISGKPIKRVINLGIGGSYLGGAMVCAALPAQDKGPQVDFANSLSPTALELDGKKDLETCLFILSSKSFGTEETLANAERLLDYYAGRDDKLRQEFLKKNFYAVTAAPAKAAKFGIAKDHILPMDSTIGGRFSLWSAIGLPIILHAGEEAFTELLQGAAAMDEHCRSAAPANNMPLVMALLSYWYVNYCGTSSICVNAYEHALSDFSQFLQQLVMESCGKQAHLSSNMLNAKSEVLWGGEGTAVQHSYMQLCHQGNQLIPIDFIIGAHMPVWYESKQQISQKEMSMQKSLIAHCLAQSQALLFGRTEEEAAAEAKEKGLPDKYIRHLIMPGNRPSNTLVYNSLSPSVLGSLIALYEHKTVLFAYLSDINPFDQWGVELGKQLSTKIKGQLSDKYSSSTNDPSTEQLITRIRTWHE